MIEEAIPLQIKQDAIARKALRGVANMKNLRMTNKSLKTLGLPTLTKTKFLKLLKDVPSKRGMDVRDAQRKLRATELPSHILEEIQAEEKLLKGGKQ